MFGNAKYGPNICIISNHGFLIIKLLNSFSSIGSSSYVFVSNQLENRRILMNPHTWLVAFARGPLHFPLLWGLHGTPLHATK